MTNTPAVGVGSGPNHRSTRVVKGGSIASRAAAYPLIVLIGLIGLVGWLSVGGSPVAGVSAPNSLDVRATYDVSADIHFAAGSMNVSSTAHVTNLTGHAVSALTFNLLPLRIGNLDSLAVTVNGKPANSDVADQSLIVHLLGSLPNNGQGNVTISYRAFFNSDTSGTRMLLMKKEGIITAYRFIPWMSKAQQFDTPNFGESWVTATSPQVDVTLTSDVALKYATSGLGTGSNGNARTFHATNVRDFNFTASPNYKVKKQTWNGIDVRVYTVDANADTWMSSTLTALQRFTDKIGPYPFSQLNVAEIPTGVGMESPGLVWIDKTLAKSSVPFIVVHEVAHQWFYSTIGNNQATNPFVDEAMAEFLTRNLLTDFRTSQCPQAPLDKSVYFYIGRCYPEVIYVQGGLYIRDYKVEVGADSFWNALGGLFRDLKFRIVSTRMFWDYMDHATGYNSALHHDRFPRLF